MNRNNRWILLVVSLAFFVFTSHADFSQAAPILLAEWTRDQAPRLRVGEPPPTTLKYDFFLATSGPEPIGGVWVQDIAASDVGMTFSAPPEIVEMVNDGLVSDQSILGGHVGPEGEFHNTIANWLVWPDGAMGITYIQQVPQLPDYNLTQITRTVNGFVVQPVGPGTDTFRFGGSQTIRLYGALVPEPTTLLLGAVNCLLIALAVSRRRPKRPSNQCRGTVSRIL
jgi:hypothetical protein